MKELTINGIIEAAAQDNERQYAVEVAEHTMNIVQNDFTEELGLDAEDASTVSSFIKMLAMSLAGSQALASVMTGELNQEEMGDMVETGTILHFATLINYLRETTE